MNKIQAAFEMLYFLCAVDGKVDDRELTVIGEFLQANYSIVSFDPREVLQDIAMLNGDGMWEEFTSAVKQFQLLTDATDRRIFLNFALKLVCADGNVSQEENNLLQMISQTWGVDLVRFLEGVNA
jgi:tellurite resistance protein